MAIDVLQKQVVELSNKVDVLHVLIEQLTEKVSGIAALQDREFGKRNGSVNLAPVALPRPVDPSMTHKDILSDEPPLDGSQSSSPHNISPAIQIQRLTAQLTAAYNRMAALEEQILACRFQ